MTGIFSSKQEVVSSKGSYYNSVAVGLLLIAYCLLLRTEFA